jgi:hypothetical protein
MNFPDTETLEEAKMLALPPALTSHHAGDTAVRSSGSPSPTWMSGPWRN